MFAIPIAIGTRLKGCLALPCMDWAVELVFRKYTRGFPPYKPTTSQMTPLFLDDAFALFSVIIPSSAHNVEYAPLYDLNSDNSSGENLPATRFFL